MTALISFGECQAVPERVFQLIRRGLPFSGEKITAAPLEPSCISVIQKALNTPDIVNPSHLLELEGSSFL